MRNLKSTIAIHHLPLYLQYFGIHMFVTLSDIITRNDHSLEQYISEWYHHSPFISCSENTISFPSQRYVTRYVPISQRNDIPVLSCRKTVSSSRTCRYGSWGLSLLIHRGTR